MLDRVTEHLYLPITPNDPVTVVLTVYAIAASSVLHRQRYRCLALLRATPDIMMAHAKQEQTAHKLLLPISP